MRAQSDAGLHGSMHNLGSVSDNSVELMHAIRTPSDSSSITTPRVPDPPLPPTMTGASHHCGASQCEGIAQLLQRVDRCVRVALPLPSVGGVATTFETVLRHVSYFLYVYTFVSGEKVPQLQDAPLCTFILLV